MCDNTCAIGIVTDSRQHQAETVKVKGNRHAISLDPGSRQAIAIYYRVYSYPTKLGGLLHQESTITIRISSAVSPIVGSHIQNQFRNVIDTIIHKFQIPVEGVLKSRFSLQFKQSKHQELHPITSLQSHKDTSR
jgi:hypothetical protein